MSEKVKKFLVNQKERIRKITKILRPSRLKVIVHKLRVKKSK